MAENSRVKFNPVTKEIEIEGSESFVMATFAKLQAILSGVPVKEVPIQKKNKAARMRPKKNVSPVATGTKRGALSEAVMTLINASPEGISMSELKEKTGMKDSQIRNVLSSVIKRGKIQAIRRGVYVVAAAPVVNPEEKPEQAQL
ncbi:MAG: hypothetical protein ACOYOS_18465 [Syntrophales bacterium]